MPEVGRTDEKNWIQKNQKVSADVILTINPSELYHMKPYTTSKDIWNKLKEVYESIRPAKATLLKILLFKKMKGNKSMNDHINIFFNIVDKLKEMDIEVTDKIQVLMINLQWPARKFSADVILVFRQ